MNEVEAYIHALEIWGSNEDPQIQRNECTRIHRLADASAGGTLIDADQSNRSRVTFGEQILFSPLRTFLVRHDWASVIKEDWSEVQIQLPYPHCAFELMIDGVPVVQICLQPEGQPLTVTAFVLIKDQWICCDAEWAKRSPVMQEAWIQVLACCVSLDAEVTTYEVLRAPYQLNKKRERSGKSPIMDCSVIDLSRRRRVLPLSIAQEGHRKRLHFRRGHWRHFQDHKTWVKWMLVGNPDLGFVASRYVL